MASKESTTNSDKVQFKTNSSSIKTCLMKNKPNKMLDSLKLCLHESASSDPQTRVNITLSCEAFCLVYFSFIFEAYLYLTRIRL